MHQEFILERTDPLTPGMKLPHALEHCDANGRSALLASIGYIGTVTQPK